MGAFVCTKYEPNPAQMPMVADGKRSVDLSAANGHSKASEFRDLAAKNLTPHALERALAHAQAPRGDPGEEEESLTNSLWTFVENEGVVVPTNNEAERGLRHADVWRKHHLRWRSTTSVFSLRTRNLEPWITSARFLQIV